jgi:hypothetical protein
VLPALAQARMWRASGIEIDEQPTGVRPAPPARLDEPATQHA